MSRVRGTHTRDYNNEIVIRKPIDARTLVPTYADLLTKDNWVKANTAQVTAYNGLVVSVADTSDTSKNGVYFLFDPKCTSALKSPDVTDEANWHKIGDSANAGDVAARLVTIESILNGSDDTAGLVSKVDANTNAIAELVNATFVTADAMQATLQPYAKTEDVVSKATFEAYVAKNDDTIAKLVTDVDKNTAKLIGIETTVVEAIEDAIEALPALEVATEEELGGIKSASGDNAVTVDEETGIASVKSININTLTQNSGDVLILNGGENNV